MNGIRNIATRYFKNDRLCQVSYAISLRDGRTIRLDVPVSRDHSEAEAKAYARQRAEAYMYDLFDLEHRTGRFECCSNFQAKGHRQNCPAVN